MAGEVKALAVKPDDLSLISVTHVVEAEDKVFQVVLTSACAHTHMPAPTPQIKQINVDGHVQNIIHMCNTVGCSRNCSLCK